jgi:hypothetical protein
LLYDDYTQRYIYLTSGPAPVSVNSIQAGPNNIQVINATFLPTKIQRGNLNYQIGFQAESCEVTWWPNDTTYWTSSLGAANTVLNWRRALTIGLLSECPLWIHQAIWSDSSTLLGTVLKWRGIIRKVESTRDYVKITVASLLDLFQQSQVPSQVIQSGNRQPAYLGVGNIGSLQGLLGSSTTQDLQFTAGGSPPADHSLADKYIIAGAAFNYIPTNRDVQPTFYRIRDNVTVSGTIHVYLYEPLYSIYLIGNGTYVYYCSQQSLTGGASGFPYVPPPETGV